MKKLLIILGLISIGSAAFAKQYVKNGIYTVNATKKLAEDCRSLISQGYHIDSVTLDTKQGRYILIYSDNK